MKTRSKSQAQKHGGTRRRAARKTNRVVLAALLLLLAAPLLWMGSERLRAQAADLPVFVQQTERLGQEAVAEIERTDDWSEERETAAWEAMGKARVDVDQMREMVRSMEAGPVLIENPADAGMAAVDGPAMHQAMNGLHELYMMKRTQESPQAAEEMMQEMKSAMQQRVETWSAQLDAMEEAMLDKQVSTPSP
jgi:hypothetical protein